MISTQISTEIVSKVTILDALITGDLLLKNQKIISVKRKKKQQQQ